MPLVELQLTGVESLELAKGFIIQLGKVTGEAGFRFIGSDASLGAT